MPVFKLTPIDARLHDERWRTTYIKEVCWTVAANERLARYFVGQYTLCATDPRTGKPIPRPASPWLEPSLARCIPDQPRFSVEPGTIVLSHGKPASLIGTPKVVWVDPDGDD